MYKVTFTQYLAPEYGDGDDGPSYHVKKELELPFIPAKDYSFQWSEMGIYVWNIQAVHYNIDEDHYYVTLQSRWLQVWDGHDYHWSGTRTTMQHMLKFFRKNGWTIRENE